MLSKSDKIGDYILLEKVGSGGFGDVWKAEKRTALDVNHFALKFFRPKDDRIDFERIGQELAVWKQLKGLPHIISVIELDQFEDFIYVVSDFADGGSLEKWLRENEKASSEAEAVRIILEILTGLENLHDKGFVHRDLKPDNILIMNGKFCLADFGVSREMKTHSRATGTAGTMEYMPPEAFANKPSVTVQTDIWAIGVILQKLLTGSLPYPQEDQPSLIAAILMSKPESMLDSISEGLREIVKKALQKDRENRFQTAREMREVIKNPTTFLESLPKPKTALTSTIIDEDFVNTKILEVGKSKDWQATEAEKERQREAEARLEQERLQREKEEHQKRLEKVELRRIEVAESIQREKEEIDKLQRKKPNEVKTEPNKKEKHERIENNRNYNNGNKIQRTVIAVSLTFLAVILFLVLFANPLFRASSHWESKTIASLLLTLGADVNSQDSEGETALHQASEAKNITNISWLLGKGAYINSQDFIGETPLMEASRFPNIEIVKFLIEKGADVNAKTTSGETTLMYASPNASSEDSIQVLKLLVEKGANVNAKTTSDETALMKASANSNFDGVKFLIDKGAEVNVRTKKSESALLKIAESRFYESWCKKNANNICQDGDAMKILRLLIEKGADVNVADEEGTTKLMRVAEQYTGAVDLLIEKGAKVNARNKKGQTVLVLTKEKLKNTSEENKKFYNQVIESLEKANAIE